MRPVSPRLDVSCLLGTSNTYMKVTASNGERSKVETVSRVVADWSLYSDGIARVHGMANVQAEELVE
jgi:hypothetical protein